MALHLDLSSRLIPSSSSYERGKFGRLFPWLPPCLEDTPQTKLDMMLLTDTMFKVGVEDQLNDMPAGYTYLGQFITHDISFDPTSINERQVDPEFLWNFRTPAVDLDSIYGGGPSVAPYFYDPDKNNGMTHFLLPAEKMSFEILLPAEKMSFEKEGPALPDKPDAFFDLPRTSSKIGTAIIADPRNDENIIISQIHAAFLQFHNTMADKLSENGGYKNRPEDLFRAAQQEVKWHYQWVVLNDYLPRILGHMEWEGIKKTVLPEKPTDITDELVREQIMEIVESKIERKYYDWRNEPFIPLEFSVAAFRFGHSQVRLEYIFNNDKSQEEGLHSRSEIFSPKELFPPAYFVTKKPFARIAMPLFFPKSESTVLFNKNKLIEPRLSMNLKKIPLNIPTQGKPRKNFVELLKEIKAVKDKLAQRLDANVKDGTIETVIDSIFSSIFTQADNNEARKFIFDASLKINESNLAERNLIRGLMLRLPSGQSVAKAMGIKPEPIVSFEGFPIEGFPPHLVDNTPLWYYILYEARKIQEGKRLGPVGSRIVAEVIIGLLQGDKTSFLNQDPNWKPAKELCNDKGEFTMVELLKLAGVYNL